MFMFISTCFWCLFFFTVFKVVAYFAFKFYDFMILKGWKDAELVSIIVYWVMVVIIFVSVFTNLFVVSFIPVAFMLGVLAGGGLVKYLFYPLWTLLILNMLYGFLYISVYLVLVMMFIVYVIYSLAIMIYLRDFSKIWDFYDEYFKWVGKVDVMLNIYEYAMFFLGYKNFDEYFFGFWRDYFVCMILYLVWTLFMLYLVSIDLTIWWSVYNYMGYDVKFFGN